MIGGPQISWMCGFHMENDLYAVLSTVCTWFDLCEANLA